ncbi:MAG: UvrD-helicase domain-containing protein, partial [Clostridia bacterium]|nr:UvrD-helicase domain-containing protein [Clostridia bacterium]
MIDISTLNSVQRQAVLDTEGGVLVFAGAGSGKTRVLTMRIANILEKGLCYPDRILAITFTNKAANEMKQRLSAFDLNVQDMWVCTIHSMCTRILRRDIDKIGYDSNFSIYSDTEKQRMLKGIIADFD